MNALDIRGLSKTFSGHVVLHGVDLTVKVGEVHAPDPGATATVLDQELDLGNATAADKLNVRFVHQDLGLVNDLSITENIMLGRTYPRSGGIRINWKKARQVARDCLARTGPPIDVNRPVGEFGIAERTPNFLAS